jgi:hypothetical protein
MKLIKNDNTTNSGWMTIWSSVKKANSNNYPFTGDLSDDLQIFIDILEKQSQKMGFGNLDLSNTVGHCHGGESITMLPDSGTDGTEVMSLNSSFLRSAFNNFNANKQEGSGWQEPPYSILDIYSALEKKGLKSVSEDNFWSYMRGSLY